MSIFGPRKPLARAPKRNLLQTLRETLTRLEAEPETPQIADLKRILVRRITEMEQKSA